MKRCPVCNARCFDDMKMCFGCLHPFEDDLMNDAGLDGIEEVGEGGCKGECVLNFALHCEENKSGVIFPRIEGRKSDNLKDNVRVGHPSGNNPKSAEDAASDQREQEMLLAIDVGNTQTVIGLMRALEPERVWRISTIKTSTADELFLSLASLLRSAAIEPASITGASLASVVPRLTTEWDRAVKDITGCSPVMCTAQCAAGLFVADYPNPQEIGQDRIADAIALKECYGAPSIVVDFGTATNIEVIDAQGRFCGGVIAPGVETSMSALFSNASRLSMVDLDDPGCIIGKNTVQAIQSGVVYGEAERVDGLVRRIVAELGATPPVVATGGLAPFMARYAKTISDVDPALTLKGLALLYKHTARK